MSQEIVIALLSPLITAAVAGLGLLLKEWRDNRRWEHRRAAVLDQGTRQVAFIAGWLTAYGNLGEEQRGPEHGAHLERARSDLDAVYASVNAQVAEVEAHRPARTTWATLASSLLLLGVRRPWAKVVRVLYLGVVLLALSLGLMMGTISMDGSGISVLAQLGISAAFTAFLLVPGGLLYVLARFLDRPPRSAVVHDLGAPGWPVVPGGGV
ncbi:hypothetical protein [Ornithinimicrobium tianjinense]|uniref:Uncharacterized protein n=1 Tax=Ornithinimicrobium tianjinense TaxID=1195761 RepID=A0A917FAZ9_9MICO|nr:hypothetical protein [Ornithinimicrobium tianjinense]GGF58726.1 hypothetical protein GCM10011366_28210 [Ornithinimicrobium tianjinense]